MAAHVVGWKGGKYNLAASYRNGTDLLVGGEFWEKNHASQIRVVDPDPFHTNPNPDPTLKRKSKTYFL